MAEKRMMKYLLEYAIKLPSVHPEMVFLPKLPTSLSELRRDKLRYARKIILGILGICLWLFFSHAFRLRLISYAGQVILNKNPHFWMDTT